MRNASAVLKNFVHHPKKTFATLSARNGHGEAVATCPLLGERKSLPTVKMTALDCRTLALSSDPFDRKPRFDLDGRFALGAQVVCGVKMNRRKLIGKHWFVSVETPKQLRPLSFGAPHTARETKAFPTEIEAKQFAIAMLSEGRKVTAGALSPHQPIRRTVTASEINRWIREEE